MAKNEKHEVVDLLLGVCLGCLVEKGFVERQSINGRWYSRYDLNHRLDSSDFLAAASIDDSGRPVVIFDIEQSIDVIAWAIALEAVHLAQIVKGDWEPFTGYSLWKGKKYSNLSGSDSNYYSLDHQPWEAEAHSLEHDVREFMYSKFPTLNRL